MKHEAIRLAALADYVKGDLLRDIALRYDVSIGTVSLWAHKAGEARRTQGCRIKDIPSEFEMEIVAACRASKNGHPSYREIGVPYHYGRASVHRIFQKWKHWRPRVPFKAGQKIRWCYLEWGTREPRFKDLLVLTPGVFDGLCRDLQNGQETIYKWWVNKHTFATRYKAVKGIGVSVPSAPST
jgi:transposase